jgi:hypothetical protein
MRGGGGGEPHGFSLRRRMRSSSGKKATLVKKHGEICDRWYARECLERHLIAGLCKRWRQGRRCTAAASIEQGQRQDLLPYTTFENSGTQFVAMKLRNSSTATGG